MILRYPGLCFVLLSDTFGKLVAHPKNNLVRYNQTIWARLPEAVRENEPALIPRLKTEPGSRRKSSLSLSGVQTIVTHGKLK